MASPLCFAGFSGFDCSLVWLAMVALFFIAATFRRQVAENILGMGFSIIGATIGGCIAYLIAVFITHNIKWGFIAGVGGLIVAGFMSAPFLPDSESGGEGGEGGEFD